MPFEILADVPGRLITVARIRRQQFADDGRDSRRHLHVEAARVRPRLTTLGKQLRQDFRWLALGLAEWMMPCEKLKQNDAERIEIASAVDGPDSTLHGLQLFRRHIGEGAAKFAFVPLGVFHMSGQVEVEKHWLAVIG